jgi:predicted enzyme related to lactoylglutathione lyase
MAWTSASTPPRDPTQTETRSSPSSLDQAVERLRGESVDIAAEISEHPWSRVATFKDPDGNDLQLYEPPSG